MTKTTPDDFYDHLPEGSHATGDIWSGLPSYGMLKQKLVAGIIITPACDLSNQKSETLTYLPVVPISSFFCSRTWLGEVHAELKSVWNSIPSDEKKSLILPDSLSLKTVVELHEQAKKLTMTSLLERLIAGLEIARDILSSTTSSIDNKLMIGLFKENGYKKRCVGLIKNSLRTDTHFLPARNKWTSDIANELTSPSLALFRYPLSVPTDVLTIANRARSNAWGADLSDIMGESLALPFVQVQPMKIARLRQHFFVDLLARYTALFSRVGSPDFHERVLEAIIAELHGEAK